MFRPNAAIWIWAWLALQRQCRSSAHSDSVAPMRGHQRLRRFDSMRVNGAGTNEQAHMALRIAATPRSRDAWLARR